MLEWAWLETARLQWAVDLVRLWKLLLIYIRMGVAGDHQSAVAGGLRWVSAVAAYILEWAWMETASADWVVWAVFRLNRGNNCPISQ